MDTIRVWDLPTRLFHWLLVAAIGFLWYSGGEGEALMVWHMRAGYLVLGLVIFRIIWGLWGSRHSRFAAFLAGPRRTLDYGKAFARGRAPVFAGHNPLGGWMVMLMLLSLLVQTATGLFATDDISLEGPLSGQVGGATARALTDVHFWNFDLLLILIAAHVAAVLLHRLLGEPLLAAMLTGRKRVPDEAGPDLAFVPWWRALLVALPVAGAIYWLVS
ncbi:cytochrome b/b6 domain-containing protein [Alloalcanivorax xenomutans]|jgi:cytochrome b|uniref:Cytochrome b/b6 domain-containing protein n=1 Tax=Alloalcanivorax xenomutans TaxID=1094342 RepID=A0A9Q3W3T0_9GAMM|nr:cytochrome b/b6 domain-containing protein [Alloalcanivorax xenomutans]ERS15265.1 hypothetical protein Q668_06740 [Alcanivorax sp. PN-3]PHS60996.1 MAG: hypothetical protein COB00_14235 [Alcanivorax sp.]ARB44620.1 hypothetical protein P40_03595 [Alloalcanivorax xenomutans]MCE7507297.1 cytochrome b/b6 domain-containing protein [Alloalcanivorax xenomutans]MCE7523100.1 cytochrome b/b6 domain-containing protein [Alloalcanivorax xenomutans]